MAAMSSVIKANLLSSLTGNIKEKRINGVMCVYVYIGGVAEKASMLWQLYISSKEMGWAKIS